MQHVRVIRSSEQTPPPHGVLLGALGHSPAKAGLSAAVNMERKVKSMKVQLDQGAFPPTRAHATDAGLDLYATRETTLWPGGSAVFDTGVHVQFPHGTYGKIESKSGLNVNKSVVSCGGVIDEGYTGAIKVKLYNLGEEKVTFHAGERIAQLVIMPCLYESVELTDEIERNTERGDSGFGSTGA